MKNLKPEVRARLEAMMKQQGVATGSDGANRVCLTKDRSTPAAGRTAASCKTDYGTRTASAWKWHSVCESVGHRRSTARRVFTDAENYTVSTTSTACLSRRDEDDA